MRCATPTDTDSTGEARQACLVEGPRYLESLRQFLPSDEVPVSLHVACGSPLSLAISSGSSLRAIIALLGKRRRESMHDMAVPAVHAAASDWRRALRRKIVWLLLAKLLGLMLLWALFFSPRHRIQITPERAAERFSTGEGEQQHHD